MAKQRPTKTVSSVSDIFGFILDQADKPPQRRTPMRPQTGDVQADSEYVSALVDTVALPTAFVGEKILGTFQDLVDNEVKIDTYTGRPGSDFVKLKVSNLPSLLSDPGGEIDKMFEKNRNLSKMQRIQWAGETARMVLGSAYATKNELFEDYDEDLKNILVRGVGQAATEGTVADKMWIVDAAQEIHDRGYTGAKLNKLQAELATPGISKQRKKILEDEVKGIEENYNNVKTMNPKAFYTSFRGLLQTEFSSHKEAILNGRNEEDLDDRDYEKVKRMDLANKTVGLWKEFEEKETPLKKRKFALTKKELNKEKEALVKQREAILRKGIFKGPSGMQIDYGQLTDDQRRKEMNNIKARLRNINDTSRVYNSMQFWTTLGNVEGLYYGVKSTLGPGGLEAMIKGDFFNPNYGYFGCPSQKAGLVLDDVTRVDVNLGEKKKWKEEQGYNIEFYKANHRGVGGMKEVNTLGGAYNDAMVQLHYLNPVTWAKTLVTGEGFAWAADKRLDRVAGMWDVDAKAGGIFNQLQDRNFWNFYSKYKGASAQERTALLSKNPQYSNIINKIMLGLRNKDNEFSKKFKRAEKLMEASDGYKKLAKFFSAPKRATDNFKNRFINTKVEAFRQKGRDLVYKTLSGMKMFTKDKAAMAMLQSWKATGGKALSSAISKALVSALGLAGTTVAGPVGAALSFLVSALLEKILKLVLKVTLYVGMGVVVLVFFIVVMGVGGIGNFKKQSQLDAYSREVAGEIYYNDFDGVGNSAALGYYSVDGDGPDGDGTNGTGPDGNGPNGNGGGPTGSLPSFVPGDLPAGETCLFSSGSSLRCTQGPYSYCTDPAYHQPSHHNSPAIDVAVGGNFNAPQFCDASKGNCKVVSTGQATCQGGSPAGGYVLFTAEENGRTYQFYVLHVSIGVSAGQTLGPGQAVATIVHDPSWQNCSTGLHAHVTTKVNGSYVNPRDVLNGDFGCSIGTCPVDEVCYWKK